MSQLTPVGIVDRPYFHLYGTDIMYYSVFVSTELIATSLHWW